MTATAIGAYATATALKALMSKTDNADDTILGLICDRVNQYLESVMHQVVAPITSATYVYDGRGLRHLYLPWPTGAVAIGGLRAASLVEVKPYSDAAYETVTSADYFLRGRASMAGPYRWLVFTDRPSGTYINWPDGYGTVRVTATAGWTAIPDDLTEVALIVAQRAWNAREVGYQDVAGLDERGQPVVSRFLAGRDKETLRRYTVARDPLIAGAGRPHSPLPLSRSNW